MQKKLEFSSIAVLILNAITVGWLGYNVFALQAIRQHNPLSELFGMYVTVGYLVAFLFHLVAFVTLFLLFRITQKITIFNVITLLAGIVSFITIIGEFGALNDIGDCLREGMDCTMEWNFLYFAFLPHALFQLLLAIVIMKYVRPIPRVNEAQRISKDDTIFVIVHLIGACCGLFGVGFSWLIFLSPVNVQMLKWVILPYGSFILLPYGLILGYWFMVKRREQRADWCDEKQWQDLNKAGMTAMIVSVPLMTLLFGLMYAFPESPAGIIWFPAYLFSVLLAFSGGTLYYRRR